MLDAGEIEALFKNYLASRIRKGAFLVSGDWGTGKTQLALTRLKPAAEELQFRTAYLSVAEIDSLESFETNLLLSSHHWLQKKWVSPLVGALRHWGNKAGISIPELVAFYNELSKSSLFIVDDLERTTPELREKILYRLATLQETKNIKTLLLADEGKIKRQDANYNTVQEKTISRTVEFQPTHDDLAKIAAKVVYAEAPISQSRTKLWAISKVLTESDLAELLGTVLHRANCRNLRAAIAATADACELYEQLIDSGISFDIGFSKAIAYSTFAYSIELRIDKGRSDNLRKFSDPGTQVDWSRYLNSGDQSKDYLTEFESKFLHGVKGDFIRSLAIINFLEKGSCDIQALSIDIVSSRPTEQGAPAYKKLIRYRSLTQSEFDLLKIEAIKELENLKIRSFHQIGESAQILFYLAERRLLAQSPVQLRICYVEVLERLAVQFLRGATDISPTYEAGLMWGSSFGELKVVLDHLQEVSARLASELFNRAKKEEIGKLSADPDAFVESLIGVDSQIARSACLNKGDADQIGVILGQTIERNENAHNVVYMLDRAIANRYSTRGLGLKFHQEIAFLEQLKTALQSLKKPSDESLLHDAIESLNISIARAIAALNPAS